MPKTSTALEVRPCEPEALERVIEWLPLESSRAEVRWRVLLDGSNAIAYDGDEPIAAGGFQLVNRGVGEVWLALTPYARLRFRAVYRAILTWMQEQAAAYRIHRFQTITPASAAPAQRLLLHLGFDYEATLKQFGADRSDWYMYAMVKGGLNE